MNPKKPISQPFTIETSIPRRGNSSTDHLDLQFSDTSSNISLITPLATFIFLGYSPRKNIKRIKNEIGLFISLELRAFSPPFQSCKDPSHNTFTNYTTNSKESHDPVNNVFICHHFMK